jgi:spermidine/putrescine transport system substrate-binding protein
MTRREAIPAALGAALPACDRDRRPRLNVLNWSSYVGPDTIPDFEQEHGVRVRYGVYESNEEMLARIMSGNSGWDVVFPTSYLLAPMQSMRLLAPVQHHRLSNLHHLAERFRTPVWDPDLRWGIPYMWNATGVCHNLQLTGEADGWDLLWDPEFQGRLTMLDDPVDAFAAGLIQAGHPINTSNPAHFGDAQRWLLRQKELLRAYINAEVRDQLAAGDVIAAQLWSTTSQQAIDERPNLTFTFPSQGFPLYMDVAVILLESRRQEMAHQFLDYLLRPSVAAGVVAGARTACANATARNLLPEQVRTLPTLFPDEETLEWGEWVLASPPEIHRLRDRLWTEVKAA